MTTSEMSAKTTTAGDRGTEVFIPLNKLKKSPRNARKTPHSGAIIESYAASIAAKGILQNLVVEPECDGECGNRLLLRQHRRGPQTGAVAAREAIADQEDRADPLRHRHREQCA